MRWAYDHDLGWVVQAAKRTGVRTLFLAGRSRADFTPIDHDTRLALYDRFQADLDTLASTWGIDVPADWRSP